MQTEPDAKPDLEVILSLPDKDLEELRSLISIELESRIDLSTAPPMTGEEVLMGLAKGITAYRLRTQLSFRVAVKMYRWARNVLDLVERFNELAEQWRADTEFLSVISQKTAHRAYQEIIRMGMPIVPAILADLRETKSDWFTALTAITGENPITEDIAGCVDKMTDAWVAWGISKGMISANVN